MHGHEFGKASGMAPRARLGILLGDFFNELALECSYHILVSFPNGWCCEQL